MIVRQFCVRHSRATLAAFRRPSTLRPYATESDALHASIQRSTEGAKGTGRPIDGPHSVRVDSPATSGDGEPTVRTKPSRNLHLWKQSEAARGRRDRMGTRVTLGHQPDELLLDPPKPTEVTLAMLLASQSHLGHATSLWNPRTSQYIYGVRDGIHIISLDVTAAYLKRACKVVEEVAARGGLILFVGTRAGQERCVIQAAHMAKGYHIFDRWTPGSLTNGQQILGHCRQMIVNSHDQELPELREHTIDKAVIKPDLVVCFNPLENEVMLHECGLYNVPTIGVVDTDANPTWVTYPVPANDDSLRCITLLAGAFGRAGEAGQKRRMDMAAEGKVPYPRIKLEELYSSDVEDSGIRAGGSRGN